MSIKSLYNNFVTGSNTMGIVPIAHAPTSLAELGDAPFNSSNTAQHYAQACVHTSIPQKLITMKVAKYILPLFITVISFTKVQAQERLLTLEEAIATVLQNNYDIQLAKNDSIIAALDYKYRNTVFYPTLNGVAGTTWNNNNQRQTLADNSKREQNGIRSHNWNASLAFSWTLFDGLRMFATRDKASELVAAGSYIIKEQMVNTIADVVNTYYNIVRQKQQIIATNEQIALNDERVKLAQYKLDIGTGAKPDVLQSKVDLNAQKAIKLEQETLVVQLKEQLTQLMNVQSTTPFQVADSIPLNTEIGLGTIQEGVETTNPTLLLLQKNIRISEFELKERKADLYPDLTFNANYLFNRTENQTVINPFSPLFNQSNGFNYGVNLVVPIFNRFTTKRLIKQTEIDIRNRQLLFQNQRSQISLAVIIAYRSYELQKKALLLEEENILLARENVDIVFQTYKLGAATLVQLREAQNSLEMANNRLIAARYALKLSETELLRLKGEIIK